MNTASISGRLTKDIELRTTQSALSVCSFTVAVDRPGVKDSVDFIDCVAWRKTAEFIFKYFQKGDPIEITGSITTRSYEDRNGTKRKAVEILCDRVGFPKQKRRKGDSGSDAGQGGSQFEELEPDEDDFPF